MTDLSKLAFDSRLNYLKRSEFVGEESVTLGGAGSSTSFVEITHNLGYVPFFVAGATLQNDSIIWSNEYVHPRTRSSLTGGAQPVNYEYWADENKMVVIIINGLSGGEQSGNRRIFWSIYLDYGS